MVVATKICEVFSSILDEGVYAVKSRCECAILISRGVCATYSDGKKDYLLSPSSSLFISKDASYNVNCTASGEILIVNFEGSIEYGPIFQKKITDVQRIYNTFSSLCQSGLSEYEKMERFYALCSSILGQYADGAQERLSHVFDYINEYFCEELSNDALANMAALSNIHFRRLFKIRYGASPHEYILSLRIDKAKRLLREKKHSIDEIASMCGFSSLYYFSGAFKKAVGVSPSEFTKKFPAI